LIVAGRQLALALALVLPQAIVLGPVNPVERGLQVVTSSELRKFVEVRPQLLKGKWFVYAGSFVHSGFFKAVGCDVYSGLRFLPDIDHFALFAARGLNLETLNRSQYLVALPQRPDETTTLRLITVGLVEWRVAPSDPLLRQLGIKYLAFEKRPDPVLSSNLIALSTGPVDGFWLYRFP
jgi:hypothetical protein